MCLVQILTAVTVYSVILTLLVEYMTVGTLSLFEVAVEMTYFFLVGQIRVRHLYYP